MHGKSSVSSYLGYVKKSEDKKGKWVGKGKGKEEKGKCKVKGKETINEQNVRFDAYFSRFLHKKLENSKVKEGNLTSKLKAVQDTGNYRIGHR